MNKRQYLLKVYNTNRIIISYQKETNNSVNNIVKFIV